MPSPEPDGLTALEIAAGVVAGRAATAPGLPLDAPSATPIEELEKAILPALLRPPCFVSFSGGRDSSLILAVATSVARREGLEPPVPATNTFPDAPESDERAWQELVVRRLALQEWLRLDYDDELDIVGPVARAVLRRHGLLFPFNAFFHAPILEAAAGGSLLTGVGGDDCLRGVSHFQLVLARRARPRSYELPRLAARVLPIPLRVAVRRRRFPVSLPWLTSRANRRLNSIVAETYERASGSVAQVLEGTWRARYLQEYLRSQRLLADDAGVLAVSPLTEPAVLVALARFLPDAAPTTRTEAFARCFPALLPRELEHRGTKAGFNEVFWNNHSRTLVEKFRQDGSLPVLIERAGLADCVDIGSLVDAWNGRDPHANSYLLLQALWVEESRPAESRLTQDAVARRASISSSR